MADTLNMIQEKARDLDRQLVKIDERIAVIDSVLNTISLPYTSRDINVLNRRLSFGYMGDSEKGGVILGGGGYSTRYLRNAERSVRAQVAPHLDAFLAEVLKTLEKEEEDINRVLVK